MKARTNYCPAWVTVKVLPAMTSVPVLEPPAVFAATVKVKVRDPVPLVPDVIVIHATLLEASQKQPDGAVRLTVPVPPAAGIERLV